MVTTETIDLSLGCTAYGASGKPFRVVDVCQEWIELEGAEGNRVKVTRSAIVRWELPPTQPNGEVHRQNFPQALSPTHNLYREYPGSIATPVDVRLLEVFAATPEKWWAPQKLARLPCMGGPTIDQVKKNLKLLTRKGLLQRSGQGRKALYKQKFGIQHLEAA
jgi:hypothetical protein